MKLAALLKNLSAAKLTRAMVELEMNTVRKQAQAIGRQIHGEAGMDETVKWIEQYSNEFHSHRL